MTNINYLQQLLFYFKNNQYLTYLENSSFNKNSSTNSFNSLLSAKNQHFVGNENIEMELHMENQMNFPILDKCN